MVFQLDMFGSFVKDSISEFIKRAVEIDQMKGFAELLVNFINFINFNKGVRMQDSTYHMSQCMSIFT